MVENQQDVYASGQYSKIKDFFIGVVVFIGLGIITGILTSISLFISSKFPQLFLFVYILPEILQIVGCILIYQKYFPGRRFVVIGMVSWIILGILLVLLLLGLCFVAISGAGY